MASLGELANVTARSTSTSSAVTGAAAVRSSVLGDLNLFATMQGQRVLTEHWYVVAAVMQPLLMSVTQVFGLLLAEQARINHVPNIDTGDTYRSIMSGQVQPIEGGATVEVSVSTPYAKFLEFGFVHHLSGKWIFNPFMIPAADAIAPAYVNAIEQVAAIAGSLRFINGVAGIGPTNSILGTVRSGLYSFSKFAGDIQVLGVIPGLSKARGLAVGGAKQIGNIEAINKGSVLARIGRLGAGRIGGGLIHGGMPSMGMSGGGVLTGASGRIYNRLSGRAFGGALKGIH